MNSQLRQSCRCLPSRKRIVSAHAKAVFHFGILCFFLTGWANMLRANVPAGIVSGTGQAVTLSSNGSTATLSNGIVSIVCNLSDAYLTSITYTYNNGVVTTSTNLLHGGTDGGQFYIGGGEYGGFGGSATSYSVVVNPATGDANHPAGDYGEIDLVSTSSTNGTVDIHFSMLRGSPGFYVTASWAHRATDGAQGMGETRTNIYAGSMFNWMSVDPGRNKLMAVSSTNTSVAVPNAPQECYLWTNGIYQGRYEDKYKYSANFGDEQYSGTPGAHRVWGWSSVGTGGLNVGLWDINASQEYYNGGPMKRELMCHIGTTILNMFNGDHYAEGMDSTFANGEVWNKVYGPYFVYCNNVPASMTDPYQASQALYNDALAQGAAEASGTASTAGAAIGATAWPYGWFYYNNAYGMYTHASSRGTVTGKIAVSDTGNPNASGSNMLVGVVQQAPTSVGCYDFQYTAKPYEFWTRADGNGNFTIPNVIAGTTGTNYTLYAFGPGAEGEFMSQNQTGGNPPITYNLPATQFSVPVTGGSTTNLGTITWTPTRVGPTVFEIGYPDRTARKFRHGDDYWVGDIGASPTTPSPVWTKYLEYPFDFPSGPNYIVGSNRWTTDWNFIQPVVLDTSGNWDNSSSNINFNLPAGTSVSGSASIYLGLASDDYAAIIVTVNGHNLGSVSGLTATPNSSVPTTGYYVAYGESDSSIREGVNGVFSDERLTFPASILNTGATPNTINIGIRQAGGSSFSDHAMYDYVRLELTGYVPPAPAGVAAYPGNSSMLLSWPVTPGATSYNILRSTTTGTNYSSVATGVTGPVCGSGPNNATWVDTTAANGTTYYYVVRSVNTTGTSGNSAQSAGAAPSSGVSTSAPATPTGLTAIAGNGQVTVNWTASANANYYTVQRSTLYNNGATLLSSTVTAAETYNTLGTITLTNTATGTSYTDASPTNGSTFSYIVTAANAAGKSSAATTANAVPLAAAPTSAPVVTATPGDEEATLTWAAVPNAVGYVIEMATASGEPYTYVASVTDLTYTIGGLADDASYYFEVLATNSGGSSANSTEVSATTAPAAPTGLAATPGNTQVTLSWTASTDATGYVLERGTASGGPYTYIGTSNGATYTDSGLANGTAYYYVVAAYDASGSGPDSSELSATPVAIVPVAPVLSATAGNQLVVLSWTSSSGATSYSLLGGTSPGGPYSSIAAGLTTTTYTDTGLANGVTYYYVVTAANASGAGAYSNEASATPYSPVVTWTGTAGSAWDTSTINWLSGSTAVPYADGDTVTFNDTGATSTVVISGSVNPESVTFNNSALAYTVSGGAISGTSAVAKSGTGALTFTNVNSYSGGTTINSGTVAMGATGSTSATLGTGTILLGNGAAFSMADMGGHNFPGNPVQVAAASAATLSSANLANGYEGPVSGSADDTLTLSGPVSLGVSGSAQFAAYNGLVVIPSGSQLRFSTTAGANGNGGASASFEVDGLMNTRNSSGAGGVILGSLSGSGRLQGQSNTPTGSVTYFVGAKNIDSTFSGVIADGSHGTSSLVKVGAGTLTLSSSNTYTGPTTVSAGILKITGSVSATSSLTISSGATFDLAGGSLSVSGSITNNGTFALYGTSALALTGSFVNNGVLELINGASLPAHFVNNGTVAVVATPVINSATSVTATNAAFFSYQISATNSPTSYSTSVLPSGLTLNTATGLISGTTTATGTSNVTLIAINAYGTGTATLALTVLSAYNAWASGYFTPSQSALSGITDTPEQDRIANGLKYFFDINPARPMNATDLAGLPVAGTETIGNVQYMTLTYRQNPRAIGATAGVETSTDMQTWSPVTPDFTTNLSPDPATGDPMIEVGVKTNGDTRMFMDLDVTIP